MSTAVPVVTPLVERDAFGIQRVTASRPLFGSKFLLGSEPLLWDDAQTSGAGTTSVHSPSRGSVQMSVSVVAGTRVRQTRTRINYEPGKNNVAQLSVLFGTGTGVTQRVGVFDAGSGLFLEVVASGPRLVRRTSVSGAPVDAVIPQTLWSLDRLNGSGISGKTLDLTRIQMLVIDFQFVAVGVVRFGFLIDGIVVYVHELIQANAGVDPMMATFSLPLRYEISGTGVAATLEAFASTVIESPESDPMVKPMSATTGTVAISTAANGVRYALLGVRLKASALSAGVIPSWLSMLGTTVGDQLLWELWFNPVVAGVFTYVAQANSSVEAATGTVLNIASGGTRLASGFMDTNAGPMRQSIESGLIQLGSTISGTPDTLVFTATPLAGAPVNVFAAVDWNELI